MAPLIAEPLEYHWYVSVPASTPSGSDTEADSVCPTTISPDMLADPFELATGSMLPRPLPHPTINADNNETKRTLRFIV